MWLDLKLGLSLLSLGLLANAQQTCNINDQCSITTTDQYGVIRGNCAVASPFPGFSSVTVTGSVATFGPYNEPVPPSSSPVYFCGCSDSAFTSCPTNVAITMNGPRAISATSNTCRSPGTDCAIVVDTVGLSDTGVSTYMAGSQLFLSTATTCTSPLTGTVSGSTTTDATASTTTWNYPVIAADPRKYTACFCKTPTDPTTPGECDTTPVDLGDVTVLGPVKKADADAYMCYGGLPCKLSVTVAPGSAAAYAGAHFKVVGKNDACESAAAIQKIAADYAAIESLSVPFSVLTSGSAPLTPSKDYKLCYCHTGTGTDCTANESKFTYSPSLLFIGGPLASQNTGFTCMAGASCPLSGVKNIGFTTDSLISLKDAADCSGQTTIAAVPMLSSDGSGANFLFNSIGSISARTLTMCFCQRVNSGDCTAPENFSIPAGSVKINAPLAAQTQTCGAGSKCPIEIRGQGLSATNHIMIVSVASGCGVGTPLTLFGRQTIARANPTIVADDGSGNEVATFEFSSPLRAHSDVTGSYRVCWCAENCLDESGSHRPIAFQSDIMTLSVTGPKQRYIPSCQIDQECIISVRSRLGDNVGVTGRLGLDDRVFIKTACTASGTVLTDIPRNPAPPIDLGSSTDNGKMYSFGTLHTIPEGISHAKLCWCTGGNNCDPRYEIGTIFLKANSRPQVPEITSTEAGKVSLEWLSVIATDDATRCVDPNVVAWKVHAIEVTTTTTTIPSRFTLYENGTIVSHHPWRAAYYDSSKKVDAASLITILTQWNKENPSSAFRRLSTEAFLSSVETIKQSADELQKLRASLEESAEVGGPIANVIVTVDEARLAERMASSMDVAEFDEDDAPLPSEADLRAAERMFVIDETDTVREVFVVSKDTGAVHEERLFFWDDWGLPVELSHPECEVPKRPLTDLEEAHRLVDTPEMKKARAMRRRLQYTLPTESLMVNEQMTEVLNKIAETYDESIHPTLDDYIAAKFIPAGTYEVAADSQNIYQRIDFSGLPPFKNYFVQVQAVSPKGMSLWSHRSPLFEVPLPCGNGGVTDQFEECDDGNTEDGDGCSSICTVEPGYKCFYDEDLLDRSYCVLVGFNWLPTFLFIIIIITMVVALSTCFFTIIKTASDVSGETYAYLRHDHDDFQSLESYRKERQRVRAAKEAAKRRKIRLKELKKKGRKPKKGELDADIDARDLPKRNFDGSEPILTIVPKVLRFLAYSCSTLIVYCQHVSILPLILPSSSMTTVKYLAYSMRYANFQFDFWDWSDTNTLPTKYGSHKDRVSADTITGEMKPLLNEANGVTWQYTNYWMANIFFMAVIAVVLTAIFFAFRSTQRRAELAVSESGTVATGTSLSARKSVRGDPFQGRRSMAVVKRNSFGDLSFFDRFAVVHNEWCDLGYFVRMAYIFFFPMAIVCLLQLASVPIFKGSNFLFTLNVFFAQLGILVLLSLPIGIIVKVRTAVQGGVAFTMGAVENALGTTFSVFREDHLDWLWRSIVLRLFLAFTAIYLSIVPWFSALVAALVTGWYLFVFYRTQPYRSFWMQIFEIVDWFSFMIVFLYAFIGNLFDVTTWVDFPIAIVTTILVLIKFSKVAISFFMWLFVLYFPRGFFVCFSWTKSLLQDEFYEPLEFLFIRPKHDPFDSSRKSKYNEGSESEEDSMESGSESSESEIHSDDSEYTVRRKKRYQRRKAREAKNAGGKGSYIKIWVIDENTGKGKYEYVPVSAIRDSPEEKKEPKKSAIEESDSASSVSSRGSRRAQKNGGGPVVDLSANQTKKSLGAIFAETNVHQQDFTQQPPQFGLLSGGSPNRLANNNAGAPFAPAGTIGTVGQSTSGSVYNTQPIPTPQQFSGPSPASPAAPANNNGFAPSAFPSPANSPNRPQTANQQYVTVDPFSSSFVAPMTPNRPATAPQQQQAVANSNSPLRQQADEAMAAMQSGFNNMLHAATNGLASLTGNMSPHHQGGFIQNLGFAAGANNNNNQFMSDSEDESEFQMPFPNMATNNGATNGYNGNKF